MWNALKADFATEPFLHQVKEFELRGGVKNKALLWSMRTGKTKQTIDETCYLKKLNRIQLAIVIAPNNVHVNWAEVELPKHGWDTIHHDYQVLTKDNIKPITKININNLTWIFIPAHLIKRKEIKLPLTKLLRKHPSILIVDESTDFSNPGAGRVKTVRALTRYAEYRRILSGSLTSNGPIKAFTQLDIVKPGIFGYRTFEDFKSEFCIYDKIQRADGKFYPELKTYRNLPKLNRLINSVSSVITRAQANLPDLVNERIIVPMTRKQQETYSIICKRLFEDLDCPLSERTSRLAKLTQIASGFIKDEEEQYHDIPHNKLKTLLKLIDQQYGKIIVWIHYHYETDKIKEAFDKRNIKYVEYHGRVSSKDKSEAIRRFNHPDSEVKIFLGHPGSAGLGLDLSAAESIIYYSQTFNKIHREQSLERASKLGGGNVKIYDLIVTPACDYMSQAMDIKELWKRVVDPAQSVTDIEALEVAARTKALRKTAFTAVV